VTVFWIEEQTKRKYLVERLMVAQEANRRVPRQDSDGFGQCSFLRDVFSIFDNEESTSVKLFNLPPKAAFTSYSPLSFLLPGFTTAVALLLDWSQTSHWEMVCLGLLSGQDCPRKL
jgi:hypothetical protein